MKKTTKKTKQKNINFKYKIRDKGLNTNNKTKRKCSVRMELKYGKKTTKVAFQSRNGEEKTAKKREKNGMKWKTCYMI